MQLLLTTFIFACSCFSGENVHPTRCILTVFAPFHVLMSGVVHSVWLYEVDLLAMRRIFMEYQYFFVAFGFR